MAPTCRSLVVFPVAAALAYYAAPSFTSGAPRGLRGTPQDLSRQADVATWKQAQTLAGEEIYDEQASSWSFSRFGAVAASVLAALLVSLAPAEEAQAARSGGRIGGSAPAARRAPPSRPPPRTAPNVINKTTVVEKTTVVHPPPVVVAPPMGMGMGMGYGMGFGAPVVVAPAPTLGDIVVGAAVNSAVHSAIAPRGPSVNDQLLQNQQRQDERQLDQQSNQIEDLKRQIADLKK